MAPIEKASISVHIWSLLFIRPFNSSGITAMACSSSLKKNSNISSNKSLLILSSSALMIDLWLVELKRTAKCKFLFVSVLSFFLHFFAHHLFTICLHNDGSMNQYLSVDKGQLLYLKLFLSRASTVVRKWWWIFHMAAIVIRTLPGADTFKEVKRIKLSELHNRKDMQAQGRAPFFFFGTCI